MSGASFEVAKRIMSILLDGGYDTRLVGGCVRDRLMGLQPKDYDLATAASPDQVTSIMARSGLETIATGIEHGTVSVLVEGSTYEVTTLRLDMDTDGRRAQVAFCDSFEADAQRRDFTINAMSEDQAGNVHDYFGGKEDLRRGRLRFVGDPNKRMAEDYLRILRYFRFAARFGFSTDKQTLGAIAVHRQGLTHLSGERIRDELLALLACGDVGVVLQLMADAQVLPAVLPGFQESGSENRPFAFVDQLSALSSPGRELARLIFLLSKRYCSAPAGDACRRLKLSKKQTGRIMTALTVLDEGQLPVADTTAQVFRYLDLIEKPPQQQVFAEFLYPLWKLYAECFKAPWHDRLKRLRDIENSKRHLRHARMPLDGRQIAELLQLPTGPEIGRWQRILQDGFWNEEWRTPDQAQKFLISTYHNQ